MTPEESARAHEQTLAIATTAAQLAAGLALVLKQLGALHPKHAEHFSMLSRHLGELFQDAKDDDLASDFGAIAAQLRLPGKDQA